MQVPLALVVDDDHGVREVVGDFLRKAGAKVFLAPEANEAVAILNREPVDVLFADLCLPGLDGIGVLQEATRIRPQVASVILTGYASLESSIDVLRLGACDYVTKPITRQKIHSAWARALDTHQRNSICSLAQRPQSTPDDGTAQCEVVAESAAMREIISLAACVAPKSASVLIQGESGVGKGLMARTIHRQSPRSNKPFIRVNCSAISQNSLESELFGDAHVVFGEADQPRRGLLELASGGTLFLDEVAELPLAAQAQLLEAFEQGHFRRAGGNDLVPVDLRVIAATGGDLEAEVAQGRFRRSMYDFLSVVSLRIPPLRYRPEDIRALAKHFLARARPRGLPPESGGKLKFSNEAWQWLQHYDWPGNARQLSTVIEHAVLLSTGTEIGLASLPESLLRPRPVDAAEKISVPLAGDLKQIERVVLQEVIQRCSGNKTAAARVLGLHRRTLYRMLDRNS